MATTEEKTQLVETLKGPRYYKISLWGYGGESAYINLSKEAYDFWKPIVDKEGDDQLVEYMLNAEDGDLDDLEVIVPPEAMFLQEETDDETYAYPWYEAPNEFVHQYGVEYSSARITVEEITSEDYGADVVVEVVDGENLQEFLDGVMEDNDYEIDLVESDEDFGDEGDYTLHMTSSEKGVFYEGRFETVGEFDPKKLKVVITEYPNGEDTVTNILYNDVDIDNDGGDTNGKGYYAAVWAN